MRICPLVLLAALASAAPASALGPADVFVIVNSRVPASRQVADHYCQKRGVPAENVVVLDLPEGEDVSRDDYNKRLRDPLRAALRERRDKVKVLLTVYGVPLRVGGDRPDEKEKAELDRLRPELVKLREDQKRSQDEVKQLEADVKEKGTDEAKTALQDARDKAEQAGRRVQGLTQQERWLSHAESVACVDSELMLLWWDDYELRRWQVNVLNWRAPAEVRGKAPAVVLVSRLDGPTAEIARRLVDDAVAVEKEGLKGKVYVDARGIGYAKKGEAYGYGGYDQALRDMAALLKDEAKLPVVLDDKGPLFEPGSCPDAALYCGWYALARYVDCCQFNRGAVAYHIASSEAVSLRRPDVKYWCPNLLKNGVAATLGPVAEPYTIGFPKPAEFFGFLATGEYTLVECYAKTALLNSWMTVLVGDPLYNPYKNAPRLLPDQVRPSPADAPFLLQKRGRGKDEG